MNCGYGRQGVLRNWNFDLFCLLCALSLTSRNYIVEEGWS